MKQSTCPVTNPRYETFSWRQNVRTYAIGMAREANVRSGGKILQVAALLSRNDRICLRVKSHGPERGVWAARHTHARAFKLPPLQRFDFSLRHTDMSAFSS